METTEQQITSSWVQVSDQQGYDYQMKVSEFDVAYIAWRERGRWASRSVEQVKTETVW